MDQQNDNPAQNPSASRRVNPRRKTRSLVADIVTGGGVTLHGVSQDVSPFGASFHITSGSVDALAVGDAVTVNTSTAEGLRAEINSIRPVSAADSRPLVGMRLLDGASWLGGEEGEAELVEPAEALLAE
jgi:hypothetical protein